MSAEKRSICFIFLWVCTLGKLVPKLNGIVVEDEHVLNDDLLLL